ncbi:hypothetical protein [Jannaschia sp. 2305UL9-9]|uniref:hypothetical protein n=1 Tax=Jannaschia sp. 2305UL9-9 TaxID=3121638 RepID=UPI0035280345
MRRMMSSPPVRRLRYLWGAVFLATAVAGTPAAAQVRDMSFGQTIGVERVDELSIRDGQLRKAFETTPYSLTTAQIRQRLASGPVLRFGADIKVTGFPETGGATEYEGGIYAGFQTDFGESAAWRYRVTAKFDRLVEDGDWVFNRIRLDQQLRYRHDRKNATTFRLRLGHRNQNETTFVGYDQTEYLLELGHVWRPWQDKRSLNGTLYAEARRADLDRFSYDEIGLRLGVRTPINETTSLVSRFAGFTRNYGTDSGLTARKDTRIKARIGVAHRVLETAKIDLFVGFDHNRSNVATRDFSGAVAGFSVTYSW